MRKRSSIAVIALATALLVLQPAWAKVEEQVLVHFRVNEQPGPDIVRRPVTHANYHPWMENTWLGEDPRLQWRIWFREGSTIEMAVRQELPRIIDPPLLRKTDSPREQTAPLGWPESQELILLLYRQYRPVEIVLTEGA